MSGGFLGTTGRAKTHIEGLGKEIERLERKQATLERMRRRGGSRGALAEERLGAVTRDLERFKSLRVGLEGSLARMESGKGMMGNALKSIGSVWAGSMVLLQPLKAASKFEDAMLGVAKQLDGARDAQGNLTPTFFKMREEIQALGRTIPMATNDLAEMTAAGLRMGVAGDEVIDFVKTSSMMAAAFELPAGKLAEEMGKIAGVYKIPIKEIGGLADAINYLDDNAQSQGGDIIEVMKRIGGVATMVGMSAKDAAALGSTFLTLGASAEVAATASNAVIRELSVAASQPKRFHDALDALGLKSKDVQAGMVKDATGTIQMVLEKLNSKEISDEKRLTIATMLFGKEYGDDVAKLAGGIEEYRRQLKLANSEEAKGSMARESAARDKTMSAQWQMLNNQIQEAMVVIGEQLMPAAKEIMGVAGVVLEDLTKWAKNNGPLLRDIFNTAMKMAGAFMVAKTAMLGLGAYRYVMGSVASGIQMAWGSGLRVLQLYQSAQNGLFKWSLRLWGAGGRSLLQFSRAWKFVGGAVREVGFNIGVLRGMFQTLSKWVYTFIRSNPLGLAIVLIGTAVTMIQKNWSSFQWFFGEIKSAMEDCSAFLKDIENAAKAAIEEIKRLVSASFLEPARERVSGWIEGAVNWWNGTTPERADATVMTRRQILESEVPPWPVPPQLPSVTSRGGKTINHTDNSTIAINIVQQPGESAAALAKQTAQEIERNRQVRQRGLMLDLVPAQ